MHMAVERRREAACTRRKAGGAVQASEHVIDGVVVKINRAGPRPEYDPPVREIRLRC